MKDGMLTAIESVVISYQDITFVCFQTGGVYLNSKTSPTSTKAELKRRASEVNNAQHVNKKVQISQATSSSGALQQWHQALSQPHNSITSPTIASASAILGSLTHSPTSTDHSHAPAPSIPFTHNFPTMPDPIHPSSSNPGALQWQNNDNQDHSNNYYNPNAYQAVYGNMFVPSTSAKQEDHIGYHLPMSYPGTSQNYGLPSASYSTTSDGITDLVLASSSTSTWPPHQQQDGGPPTGGSLPEMAYIPRQRNEAGSQSQSAGGGASGSATTGGGEKPVKPPAVHRVRKNDKNRVCTSCGTANSPGECHSIFR